MDELFAVLGWGSPIGIGLFLLFLGGFIYLLTLADKNSKKKKK